MPGMDCRKAREHVAVGFSGESAKDIAVEELVAKLALRIELPGEGYKVRQPLVPRSQLRGRQGEQLSPMWSRIEGSQLSFDLRKQLADGGPVLLPGEMDRDAILLAGCTHPEIVTGDGANLGDEQVRADLIAQPLDGENGLDRVPPGYEVFGL